MTEPGLSGFGHPGTFINDVQPKDDQLYMDQDQLLQEYGMRASLFQLRFAMSMMHTVINRPSLWVEEYEERLEVPSDRQQVILAAHPVVKIVQASGRYAYGRRDRRTVNQVNYDYLAALAVFGSPPRFTEINPEQIELYPPTGECWLPTGFFLINYTQVQIKYLAGYTNIPARAKTAMANIINEVCAKGVGDRTSYQVGKVKRGFSSATFVTQDTYALLDPFIARALF